MVWWVQVPSCCLRLCWWWWKTTVAEGWTYHWFPVLENPPSYIKRLVWWNTTDPHIYAIYLVPKSIDFACLRNSFKPLSVLFDRISSYIIYKDASCKNNLTIHDNMTRSFWHCLFSFEFSGDRTSEWCHAILYGLWDIWTLQVACLTMSCYIVWTVGCKNLNWTAWSSCNLQIAFIFKILILFIKI